MSGYYLSRLRIARQPQVAALAQLLNPDEASQRMDAHHRLLWSAFCGDPRTASVDGIDFIECIPFSETRNYVMRVMEGMQVYRARLNNGTAPVTLTRDLNRGGYSYAPATPAGT